MIDPAHARVRGDQLICQFCDGFHKGYYEANGRLGKGGIIVILIVIVIGPTRSISREGREEREVFYPQMTEIFADSFSDGLQSSKLKALEARTRLSLEFLCKLESPYVVSYGDI
jgi:hypothetical protein